MTITIGSEPESDFDDPIGMLEDCHRRIEKFLDLLLTLASQAQGNVLTAEQCAALEVSLRYFREAAPKHTADEEDSLFPRLRNSEHSEAGKILFDLDHLHTDHVRAEENHRAVDELIRRWLANGRLSTIESTRLTSLLHSLRDTYTQHIQEEETRVFPLAASILTAANIRNIGLEMAERRGLTIRQK